MRPYRPVLGLFWACSRTIKFIKKLKLQTPQNEVSNSLEIGCFGLQLSHRGRLERQHTEYSEFGPAGAVTEGAPFTLPQGLLGHCIPRAERV